jgi:hypothetical protein
MECGGSTPLCLSAVRPMVLWSAAARRRFALRLCGPCLMECGGSTPLCPSAVRPMSYGVRRLDAALPFGCAAHVYGVRRLDAALPFGCASHVYGVRRLDAALPSPRPCLCSGAIEAGMLCAHWAAGRLRRGAAYCARASSWDLLPCGTTSFTLSDARRAPCALDVIPRGFRPLQAGRYPCRASSATPRTLRQTAADPRAGSLPFRPRRLAKCRQTPPSR